jgi:hypothetical protein
MRRIALLALLSATSALTGPALAAGLSVDLDQVRTVTFRTPVSTIYVGNPSIADINMIDSRHAFVLGKGYGTTNLIALNRNGVAIVNEQITVLGEQGSMVTLNRGAQRMTYNCASRTCQPIPVPGDGKDAFDAASGQLTAHQDMNKKAAAGQ